MHALKDRCIYDEDSVKRVKYVYDHGHQLASHTWAHKDLTTLSWDNSACYFWITFMTVALKPLLLQSMTKCGASNVSSTR